MMTKNNLFRISIFILIAAAVSNPALCASGDPVKITLPAEKPPDTFRSWAPTPPMGWNSWDVYGPSITEAEARANAEVMARVLKPHGWQYFVIDIRWFVANEPTAYYNTKDPEYVMDEYGRLMPAPSRFPSAAEGAGFKPLADYMHSLGLKFGIHIMRGVPVIAVKKNTPILDSTARAADIYSAAGQCNWLKDMYTIDAKKPGAQEYYDSIFALYASWGVDFVKVDDLSSPYHADEIEMIRRAIDRTGRPIVFSTSPGQTPIEAAEHLAMHANMWRISGDFWDDWRYIMDQFNLCAKWAPHARPGNWPDADMLPLGWLARPKHGGPAARMTKLTRDEQYTLMSLWSIVRSPLMVDTDLTNLDDFTRSLLTNDEVIAVNQAGSNPRVIQDKPTIVWASDAPGGGKYVALLNPGYSKAKAKVSFAQLGLPGSCRVRDLWAQQDLGTFEGFFLRQLPVHGAGLYKIEPDYR